MSFDEYEGPSEQREQRTSGLIIPIQWIWNLDHIKSPILPRLSLLPALISSTLLDLRIGSLVQKERIWRQNAGQKANYYMLTLETLEEHLTPLAIHNRKKANNMSEAILYTIPASGNSYKVRLLSALLGIKLKHEEIDFQVLSP